MKLMTSSVSSLAALVRGSVAIAFSAEPSSAEQMQCRQGGKCVSRYDEALAKGCHE